MAVRPLDARPARALQPAPAPAPKRRPHLHVVPPDYVSGRARRKRARLLVVLGGVLVAATLFGVVAFHVVLTQGQLDLQHLQAKASAASVRQQQLRLEAARLESPERVVADARRLGMVPPSFVRYLTPGDKAPPLPPLEPTTAAAPSPKTPPKSAVSAVRPGSAAKNPRLEASPAGAATAVRRPAAPTATSVPKPAATTATTARPTR